MEILNSNLVNLFMQIIGSSFVLSLIITICVKVSKIFIDFVKGGNEKI